MAFREPFHFFIRETTGETTGDDPSVLYDDDDIYRKTTLLSSHRSTYCLPEGRQSSPRIWHAAPPERHQAFQDVNENPRRGHPEPPSADEHPRHVPEWPPNRPNRRAQPQHGPTSASRP